MSSESLVIPSKLSINKAGYKTRFVVFSPTRIVFVPYNAITRYFTSWSIIIAVLVVLLFCAFVYYFGYSITVSLVIIFVLLLICGEALTAIFNVVPGQRKIRIIVSQIKAAAISENFKQFENEPGFFYLDWSNILAASVISDVQISSMSLAGDDIYDVEIMGFNFSSGYHERAEMAKSVKQYLTKHFPEKIQKRA